MNTLIIAWYELKRMMKAKVVIFVLFLTPLLLIFILGSALSNVFNPKDKEIETVNLVYFNDSEGHITEGFVQFLDTDEVNKYIEPRLASSKQGVLDDVASGKADIGLYIPSGFDQSVLIGQSANWEFALGSDKMKNMTARMLIETFLDETNRVQALMMTLGPAARTVMGEMETMDSQQSEYVVQGKINNSHAYSAMQYYSSTMLVMFLLYAGMTAAISLIKEKEKHTLSRMQSMPIGSIQIIIAKLFGNGMLSSIQAVLIISVSALVYGVYWGNNIIPIMLICLFTILTSMALAFTITLISKNTSVVSGVFGAFIGIMTYVSGGMTPFSGGFMAVVQKFTINYWASSSFIELMTGGSSAVIQHNLVILGSIGVSFMAIALLLYRKVGFYE